MKRKKPKINESQIDEFMIKYDFDRKKIIKAHDNFITNIMKSNKEKINMANNVIIHKNDIWCPPLDLKLKSIAFNSCFTIKESKKIKHDFKENNYNYDKYENILIKSKKIILNLNVEQKRIINSWLDSYLKMYNITLKHIKKSFLITKKMCLNWKNVRTILLKDKYEIIKKCSSEKNKCTKVTVHDLDYAIKLACQNYKSAWTNKLRHNIKHFRIRYWNKNKTIKIMDIEKQHFNSGSLRKNILGDVEGLYNGKKFNFYTIANNCRLTYDSVHDEYILHVPENVFKKEIKKNNKMICLDPGIRTFATGITENKVVEIGTKCGNTIQKYLQRKDKIMNNANILHSIKIKNEKICNKKISNYVNEIHWQSINYLTNNYDNIFIGNMSSKNIISNNNYNQLSKMTKRIASTLSFFTYRSRLQYKCATKNIKYKCIDEKYTSKMCSMCGNINYNLGSSKIYNCIKCNLSIDRDVNGCRNIYFKNIK